MNPEQIGANVRAAREEMGLTLDALAEAAKISRSTLKRMERGGPCGLHEVVRVAQVLGRELELRAPAPPETIHRAVLQWCGAEWLLGRPSVDGGEARALAQLLSELLRAGTWQSTAESYWRRMRDKLRRMATPRRRG